MMGARLLAAAAMAALGGSTVYRYEGAREERTFETEEEAQARRAAYVEREKARKQERVRLATLQEQRDAWFRTSAIPETRQQRRARERANR